MFAKKSFFLALLSLSLSATVYAAPTEANFKAPGFGGFGGNQNQNKGNQQNNQSKSSNTEQCATAVSTVTVTAASSATSAAVSNVAVSTGNKGGNNSSGKGAAGNNNDNKGSSSAAASTTTASAAASSSTSKSSSSSGAGGDIQSSLTLDPSVLATGFENDGQDQPTAGQVASLTSSNNFINFCATVPNLPITNGLQIKTGSCNPAPMGIIAATTNMPSSKFTNPKNLDTIKANTAFTITMAISHLETGHFVNANENYFSAPQQINSAGDIQGHSHLVIEAIDSLTSTQVTDPTKFAFFKGLNDPATNGVLSADVTAGLPAGVYRLASINTAANHQPALVAIAQHGTLDDMVYFTVTDDGAPAAGSGAAASNSTAAATATAAASSSAAAKATAKVGGLKGGKKN